MCVGAVFEVWPGGRSGTSRASQVPCAFRRAVSLPCAAELVNSDYFMAASLSVARKAKTVSGWNTNLLRLMEHTRKKAEKDGVEFTRSRLRTCDLPQLLIGWMRGMNRSRTLLDTIAIEWYEKFTTDGKQKYLRQHNSYLDEGQVALILKPESVKSCAKPGKKPSDNEIAKPTSWTRFDFTRIFFIDFCFPSCWFKYSNLVSYFLASD